MKNITEKDKDRGPDRGRHRCRGMTDIRGNGARKKRDGKKKEEAVKVPETETERGDLIVSGRKREKDKESEIEKR